MLNVSFSEGFVVVALQSQLYISNDVECLNKGVGMDYQNEETSLLKKTFNPKRERLSSELETVTLRDIPLEARRKEARKPLFLIRYE